MMESGTSAQDSHYAKVAGALLSSVSACTGLELRLQGKCGDFVT